MLAQGTYDKASSGLGSCAVMNGILRGPDVAAALVSACAAPPTRLTSRPHAGEGHANAAVAYNWGGFYTDVHPWRWLAAHR